MSGSGSGSGSSLLSVGACARLWRWDSSSSSSSSACIVSVLRIYRYLQNDEVRSCLGIEVDEAHSPSSSETDSIVQRFVPPANAYVYDIVLCDGEYETKVVLHPALNALVHSGHLHRGCLLDVYKVSTRYLETVLNGEIVVITEVGIVRKVGDTGGDIHASASSHEGHARVPAVPRVHAVYPLAADRAYYLHQFNDDEVLQRYSTPAFQEDDLSDPVETCPPHQLVERAESFDRKNPPDVICRVVAKSRVFHWGDWRAAKPYPFRFELIVRDDVCSLKVVVWNQMYQRCYLKIQPNDIIMIRSYKFRKDKQGNQEISVNARNPAGTIIVLDEEFSKSPLWSLPPLKYDPVQLKYVSRNPEGKNFDVIGMVTFVGRFEREYSFEKRSMFQYVWAMIGDCSHNKLLSVKLYSNSRGYQLHNLAVGKVVLLSNVQSVSVDEIVDSFSPRSVCCSSTCFTDIVDEASIEEHFSDNDFVKEVLTWSKRASTLQELQKLETMYRWSADVQFLSKYVPAGITRFRHLRHIMNAMHIRQSCVVMIQAKISDIVVSEAAFISVSPKKSGRKRRRDNIDSTASSSSVSCVPSDTCMITLRLCDLNARSGVGRRRHVNVIGGDGADSSAVIDVLIVSDAVPHAVTGAPLTLAAEEVVVPDTLPGLRSLARVTESMCLSVSEWRKVIQKAANRSRSHVCAVLKKCFTNRVLVFTLRLHRCDPDTVNAVVTGIFSASTSA